MTDREILELFHESAEPERAFELLVKKYQQKIYWQIRRMLNEHENSNDVMQNVFIKIWLGLAYFRAESQLYTWIYRIVANETLTFIEQQKRRSALPLENEDGEEAVYQKNISSLQSDTWFDGDEIQLKLQAAISTLPEKQRIVFTMKYFEEITYEEMSEILGTSVGALKASYFHAVKKIEFFLTKP
jgi:RNA polymerase sigma-70 factor (ECF subfamily)